MNKTTPAGIFIGLTAVGLGVFGISGCNRPSPAKVSSPMAPPVAFKPQEMADALHAVIAADDQIYVRQVKQHFGAGDIQRRDELLGFHAQRLRLVAESIQQSGAEFHYVLRSLWPTNPKNLPVTETEKKGLQYVSEHSGRNFYAEESLGGRRYFIAVYGMVATEDACADCHNRNAASPGKAFKTGDVMGGLIVRVPLEF